MDVEESDARGGGEMTPPSRISMAALCTPNGTPLPSSTKTAKAYTVENGDEDVSMKEVEGDKSPNSKGKEKQMDDEEGEALGDQDSDEDEEGGEGEGEEDEEDDEDDEEDEEEEEEDDDDEEGSASDSGTFQSVSEMEGVQSGDITSKKKSPANVDGAEVASSETMPLTSDEVEGSSGATLATVVEPGAEQRRSGSADATKKEPPKKRRPAKRRSPSVDLSLPVGPPARPTMRLKLTVAHDDEEEYMTNVELEIYKILEKKKHPWADWYKTTLPESELANSIAGPSNERDLNDLGGLAKLLQKYPDKLVGGAKKKKFDEYDIGQYDVKDPFVDDSELGVDEPTHSAKPSSDGFFVTQGEVELQKAIAAAKDTKTNLIFNQTGLGKRAPIPTGFGQGVDGGGGGAGAVCVQMGPKETLDHIGITNVLLARHAVKFGMISPAAEDDDSRQSYFNLEVKPGSKSAANDVSQQKSESAILEGSQQSPIKVDDEDGDSTKRNGVMSLTRYPTRQVPQRLEREFDMLRQKVAKESWLKKARFPPDLRDPLMQVSKIAIALNEYNDNFFNWLPQIFPYNRLTLHKYTKRQFVNDHVKFMEQLLDLNLKVFELQLREAFPMLEQEYEEAKRKWSDGGGSSQLSNIDEHANNKDGEEVGVDHEGEVDGEEALDKGEEDTANKGEPLKRWRWTESMREVLFTIVTVDSAIVELRNEKAGLDGLEQKASFINARKVLYKKLHDFWPDRKWTTTTAISREYGMYKKKVEKYTQQYFQTQGRDIDFAIAL